jgi:CRISPR-associated protein Csh1
MLQELKAIGEYMREEEGRDKPQAPFIQNYHLKDYDTIIAVQFKKSDQEDREYEFSRVTTIDLEEDQSESKGNASLILYRRGSPHRDPMPTSRQSSIYVKKVFERWYSSAEPDNFDKEDRPLNLFQRWYGENKHIGDPLIQSVLKEYNEKEDIIRDEIDQEAAARDGKLVLTVQYEKEDGDMGFIGEFEFFRNFLEMKVKSKEWSRDGNPQENVACAGCREETKVFSSAFPFNFYNTGNPRFAPDFKREQAWRNVPLCETCAEDAELGKIFLKKYGNFKWTSIKKPSGGYKTIRYYVLPSFPLTTPQEEVLQQITGETGGERSYTSSPFLSAEGFYRRMNPDYQFQLNFIFYEGEATSQKETVQKYVEDVAPTHILKAEEMMSSVYIDIYRGGKNRYTYGGE